MRISEWSVYTLGLGLAVFYGLEMFLVCFVLAIVIIMVAVVGAIVEGVRFYQWFFYVGFIPQIILIVMDIYSAIALGIYCFFLAIPIILALMYGNGDFSRLKMTGPYEVGHQDSFLSPHDGTEVSVFYPMDRDEYKATIKEKGRNPYVFRHGYASRMGLV